MDIFFYFHKYFNFFLKNKSIVFYIFDWVLHNKFVFYHSYDYITYNIKLL